MDAAWEARDAAASNLEGAQSVLAAQQAILDTLVASGAEDPDLEELQALIDQAQRDVDDAETEVATLQEEAEIISSEVKAL